MRLERDDEVVLRAEVRGVVGCGDAGDLLPAIDAEAKAVLTYRCEVGAAGDD